MKKPENPPAFPECKWCSLESYIKQGKIYLCKKHYRFQTMRTAAKRNNKYTPTYDELELLHKKQGMICVGCNNEMVWLSKEDRKLVISLQHDRGGDIKFLCRSCNTKHASKEGDSFYDLEIEDNEKYCPSCSSVKSKDFFYVDKKRYDGLKSTCKSCADIKTENWRDNNKDKYNEYQRKYRSRQN